MRWNCMSKALHFLQVTAKQQYCQFFTVFLTLKTLSQNISITLLQISLKLHEHRGGYWRIKLPWTILEEQFPVPRYTATSKIGNSVISLLWQLRCHCNPDHNKFSSLSNTTVVTIFPKLCLWRRSLCSNLGGIDPEKLYRATLNLVLGAANGDMFCEVYLQSADHNDITTIHDLFKIYFISSFFNRSSIPDSRSWYAINKLEVR